MLLIERIAPQPRAVRGQASLLMRRRDGDFPTELHVAAGLHGVQRQTIGAHSTPSVLTAGS